MYERLLMPQEIEVLYILPAIRREFSIALKALGLDQKSIAWLLSVTEPAISQYLSGRRASQLAFDKRTLKDIAKSAKRLALGNGSFLEESQKIMVRAFSSGITCRAHKEFGGAPKDCQVCQVSNSLSEEVEIRFAKKQPSN